MPVLTLPPGYHDRSVLTTYLQSTDVLTGVVVAIGINDYSHHREKMGPVPMQELMQSVETMVSGLLREESISAAVPPKTSSSWSFRMKPERRRSGALPPFPSVCGTSNCDP